MHLRVLTVALAAALSMSATAAPFPAHPVTKPDLAAADIAARVKAISDDAFEGRGPGTKNGEVAADWIAAELKRVGVKPAVNGSYFQTVPVAVVGADRAKSHLSFATPKGELAPNFPDAAVYWTPRYGQKDIKLDTSEVVFVGYGVVAPEFGWNDYAGLDVKGKTVIILVNDPGNEDASPDPAFFGGKAMTYYGRWTYKFEEAARQGAAAAIIVHETAPAAYGWSVVRTSNSGDKYWPELKDKNAGRAAVEGWMTLDTAKDLFARAGLDYATAKAAANQRGFKAMPMAGVSLNATVAATVAHVKTRNVIGVIPGKTHPKDVVMFSAHWDHLGIKPFLPGADKIYNGAIDNGLGVGVVLELAEAFAHDSRPQRSVAFAFWTLEEQGLQGSTYFAANPVWPLANIVGLINTDAGLVAGRARDMSLTGNGQTELEDLLAGVLKTQSRVITPDGEPEKGGFFRSDHFSLVRVGVPAITPGGGGDLVNGGRERSKALGEDYVRNRYHQPADEFDPAWDFSGQEADAEIFHAMGDTLANSDAWPGWKLDGPAKTARDAMMAKKAAQKK